MPTPDQIKDFAVSYEALWEALRVPERDRNRGVWNSIACWASILHGAQINCGVEIMPAATCLNHASKARAEMARIDSIMHGSIHEDGIPPHDRPILRVTVKGDPINEALS